MIEIKIIISTNGSQFEKEKLSLPREAIDEFLELGFSENVYDGEVLFKHYPRAISPDFMQIFIDLKNLGETIIVWGTIIRGLIEFIKKCKGYENSIHIYGKKDGKKISFDLTLDENSNCEEIVEEIENKLK